MLRIVFLTRLAAGLLPSEGPKLLYEALMLANAVVKSPIIDCKAFFFWRILFFSQPVGLVELAA